MSHEIEIPQETVHILTERIQVWTEMDSARSRAGQLNQLAEKVGGLSGSADELKQPLTQSDDPRVEIDKVLAEANNRISELGKVDSEISEAQKQIEAIKSRASTMIVLIVIGLVVAVVVVVALLSNAS